MYRSLQMAKRGSVDMYTKRQTFSDLNGSDSDESDVGSSEMLAVKRSLSSFVWEYDAAYLHFGFVATDDAGVPKSQCVVCGVVLSNDSMKPSHLNRHLRSKHKISTYPKEFFERKRAESKCAQKKIYGLTHINTKALCAFYKLAVRIAKAKKPYSDDEMLAKDCIQDVCLEVLGEAAATKIAKVPLSSDTTARRVADLAENMEIQLINQIELAKYYSLQLDKSADILNKAILMVYALSSFGPQLDELSEKKQAHTCCCCGYSSSSSRWRYGMNGNSGSCRQPN